MLIIVSMQSYKLGLLSEIIKDPECNWTFIELERYDISGIPLVRIALKCDSLPPPEFEVPIEGIIEDKQYCKACLTEEGKLTIIRNHSNGFCTKHRNRNPARKKAIAKYKKKKE